MKKEKDIKYMSVKEASLLWDMSDRTIRNYCATGIIKGVKKIGKTYYIPFDSFRPERINKKKNKNYLLEVLREEKKSSHKGRIYHRLQIDMTYNSNHIEGSTLTHDETRYIFETRTIGKSKSKGVFKVDDIIETINHFSCIDYVIDMVNYKLSERFIKELHRILKSRTKDATLKWFNVGDYKKLPNEVGGHATSDPKAVKSDIEKLLKSYNKKDKHTFDEILDFHVRFENIHPFQDGNGRVGRLITFKECLKNNIVPFIINDELKLYYYRGLDKWPKVKGYLRDTCLTGQDIVKKNLKYFNIKY